MEHDLRKNEQNKQNALSSNIEVFENRMYNVADFVKITGISRSGAYKGLASGLIPSVRLGKRLLISGQYIKSLLSVV